MKFVEPLREPEVINAMKDLMIEDGNIKLALLFTIGINTGIRISDLLALTFEKLQEKTPTIKEKKTKKTKRLRMNDSVLKMYQMYQSEATEAKGLLFRSDSNRVKYTNKPWTSSYVSKALKVYAERAGAKGNIASHSLRKTFGYFMYKKTNNLAMVQKELNHSSQAVTLRYIGIEEEMIDNAVMQLNLG